MQIKSIGIIYVDIKSTYTVILYLKSIDIYLHCLRCSGTPSEYVNIDENMMRTRSLLIENMFRHILMDLFVYPVVLCAQFNHELFSLKRSFNS